MNHTLSPLDGRYSGLTKKAVKYFSEFGLFKYRTLIEIEYYIQFCKLTKTPLVNSEETLRTLYMNFTDYDFFKIKEIENQTKHDVKAVEYFLRDKFKELGETHTHFIHYALTSQDINNTALPLSIKDFLQQQLVPDLYLLSNMLESLTFLWKNDVMISRTHGQPAVPTTMGKEIKVFSYRLQEQLLKLDSFKLKGKFGGAVGNFNAHVYTYPTINWKEFGDLFLHSLGLERSQYTTQIDNYDNLAELFDCVKRINMILLDMCQDIWLYISQEYLIQKKSKGQIGSSTMPHKVNPINFENAEGNLLLSTSLFELFSKKLPVSRLQRDLTDSTLTRNIGVAFGYLYVAIENIKLGLLKLELNRTALDDDLQKHTVVITEGIQTQMRKDGNENAYEIVKEKIDAHEMDEVYEEFNLKIKNYVGYSTV